MRVAFKRLLPPIFSAALLAGCGGMQESPVPQSPAIRPASAARFANRHETISCGSDSDSCENIRLVAPLDIAPAARGMALSLSSTECAHAHVRIEDGALPLSPATYNSARTGLAVLSVAPMTDPCARRDRHDDAVRLRPMILVTPTPSPLPGNTDYYVIALFQGADGSLTASTLDGPANLTGTTLTFASPVLMKLQPGTYAFYLATERTNEDDG